MNPDQPYPDMIDDKVLSTLLSSSISFLDVREPITAERVKEWGDMLYDIYKYLVDRLGEPGQAAAKDIDDLLLDSMANNPEEIPAPEGEATESKNKKRRRVDMTPHLADALKALRVTQKKRALKEGKPVSEWVFGDGDGEMLTRDKYKRALHKRLSLAGLRTIRVHDLRHSYATIRLLRGHNVGDVSYQLGHSSIKITYDVYAHWIPGKFKSEVDELDNPQQSATPPQPVEEISQVV